MLCDLLFVRHLTQLMDVDVADDPGGVDNDDRALKAADIGVEDPIGWVIFPCGQKSLHSGYFVPPRDSAHALSVYTLSHEMPTTWALPPAKRSWRALSAGASLFQVFVKAKAKNASTTR
jgi:hypothetical protein